MFPILALAAASAVASFAAAKSTNSANKQMAANQMAFQDASNQEQMDFQRQSMQDQMAYGREMAGRQENYQWASALQAQEFDRAMAKQAQDYNWASMTRAMDYNTWMSNTSYQRGMQDMRAAGLNPILAFGQGGATAPTVGAPSSPSPTAGSMPGASGSVSAMPGTSSAGSTARMENTIAPALASAFQGARFLTELDQLQANVDQTKATTQLIGHQGQQVQASTALQTAQAITEGVRPGLIQAQLESERQRPNLYGAQTSAAAAAARASDASAVEAGARTEGHRIGNDLTYRFGRGPAGDMAGTADALARRGGASISEGVSTGIQGLWNSLLQRLRETLQ